MTIFIFHTQINNHLRTKSKPPKFLYNRGGEQKGTGWTDLNCEGKTMQEGRKTENKKRHNKLQQTNRQSDAH